MQIVSIFLISLLTAVIASLVAKKGFRLVADVAISATSTAISVGLGYIAESAGTEWSFNISLFIAAAMALGLSALARRPLLDS